MPLNVEKLLVFLASPSDVVNERDHVHKVIAELNRTVAPEKDVVLQVVSWEKDTFPGYGTDAQSVINAQIAEMKKYSLFVGIMWNRVGTPTPRAESGTIEEFERAVEAHCLNGQPEIWFYFRKSPSILDTDEKLEQRRKVVAFTKRVEANGMPFPYKSPSDFRDQFRQQLTIWLNSRAPPKPGEKQQATEADEGSKASSEIAVINVLKEFIEQPHWSQNVPVQFSITNLSDTSIKLMQLDLRILEREMIDKKAFKKGGAPLSEFKLFAEITQDDEIDLLDNVTQFILDAGASDAFNLALAGPEGYKFKCQLRAGIEVLAAHKRILIESVPFVVQYPIRSLEVLKKREEQT